MGEAGRQAATDGRAPGGAMDGAREAHGCADNSGQDRGRARGATPVDRHHRELHCEAATQAAGAGDGGGATIGAPPGRSHAPAVGPPEFRTAEGGLERGGPAPRRVPARPPFLSYSLSIAVHLQASGPRPRANTRGHCAATVGRAGRCAVTASGRRGGRRRRQCGSCEHTPGRSARFSFLARGRPAPLRANARSPERPGGRPPPPGRGASTVGEAAEPRPRAATADAGGARVRADAAASLKGDGLGGRNL